ncbi:APC family permease [Aquaticitalea lipolytica]|uniref:APC family permease n=1 Tax=Aquaticitalea lipolytica TaxID=1247562 RepID=UPI0024BA6D44|nr:APC family permease [Aquaticitalea lipolytica]
MKEDKGLKRTVGTLGLSANIINIIVGAGIFALPAIIASKIGASSIFAYIFCGILIMLIMLCFAEAGSKLTVTGGAYTYIEAAFGKYAGYLGGVFFVFSCLLADATVSNALIDVMSSAFPVFENQTVRVISLFVVFFGLAYINVIGIKQGIGLVKFNTIAKLVPLLLIIFFGWKNVSLSNLAIESVPTIRQLGETSLILFFAFQGGDTGLIIGGEVINPKRTIPKAIFISIIIVVILYILIQMVSQGVLGSDLSYYTASPLAETAKVIFGPIGFVILIAGAAISMFGNLSGAVLNLPRVVYALARDKVIPLKPLALIHKSFATPYVSIIVYASIGFIIASVGGFEQLVTMASASLLIIYLGVALSVIKLRYSQKSQPDEFKIPGGLLVPILSIAIILYFLSYLTKNEMVGAGVFLVIISIIYGLIKVIKRKKT